MCSLNRGVGGWTVGVVKGGCRRRRSARDRRGRAQSRLQGDCVEIIHESLVRGTLVPMSIECVRDNHGVRRKK